ncbi:torsin-1A-interacting protein 2-like isoform X1 [Paralichthys olivaceus]|uniref:torsin-1A-interacting protein 2-like isoform X1 n=1 Tax=Paralichthys olivaceus TaxID=8255 RepID=UPI0037501442
MAGQETESTQQLKLITETDKPKDDTNSLNVVNGENKTVKKDSDENIIKPDDCASAAAPTNEETEDDTGEPTAAADGKNLTGQKAPDTTSSPTLVERQTVQVEGSSGGPDVQPHGVEDKPKEDTNSLNVVNGENKTVKKDSDDNVIKPDDCASAAAPTNEGTEDDTGELTAAADGKNLTGLKAPYTTTPTLVERAFAAASTNKQPTVQADGKSEDLTEKKAPVTSSPTLNTVKTDQVDGFTGGPDVQPHRDEDITNEAAGDHEGSPEHDSPEPEMLDTKDTEEETHNWGIPVETIKSVSVESVEHTATDDTGILRGNFWVLTAVAVVVVAACLAIYLTPSSPSETPLEENSVAVFLRQMEKVKAQFLNQRAEVWKRSRIHLQRHLQTAHPTAPVSLILTAGLRAEKTLHCLAQGLASSLSFALKASVLQINGTSTASQDSDQVKLDIDRKLQSAFEGDKPVAIIHRFEELPPGSTLIFYRYCDHENAAYKETFLIFTVLLEEEEEIPAKMHLNAVEEMVDDHLKKKFLSHDHPVSFDRMDIDKYGGLWSRISHLILPVAAEDRIEHEGCQG